MNATNCSNGDSKSASALARQTARSRLAALGLACLAALTVVIWIKSLVWERLARLEGSFAAMQSDSYLLGLQAREMFIRLNGMLLRYQLSGDVTEKESFSKLANELTQRFASGQAHLRTSEERQLVGQLDVLYQRYLDGTAELRERAIRGLRKESVTQMEEAIRDQSRPVLDAIDELAAAQQSTLGAFFNSSQEAMSSLQRLLWLAVILLVALIGMVAVLSYRALVAPLRSQLNESQSLAERQEKLASLGALAAGVAHEIRNPLTAIKFRLFSLGKALPVGLADNEDLTIAHSELNRLERIVKDFLQFARPSDPVLTDVPVAELLRQTQRLLRDELNRRGVQLSVTEGHDMVIRADRQQIQQVLINLIQNAAESIEHGGTVILGARRGASRLTQRVEAVVILEVTDSGKGVPKEAEKRLFDPFYSTKESGTGLGLPIAARLIEKHGGFIQYATRPGHGTTFGVVLPAVPSQEPSSPTPPAVMASHGPDSDARENRILHESENPADRR